MSRRKSVAVKPQATATVLRQSARLISKKSRGLTNHAETPAKDRLSCSNYASSPATGGEAVRKRGGDFRREASKRLAKPLRVFVSPGLNGSIDGFRTLRRSPRLSSRGNSDAETKKSTQGGSGKLSVSSLDRTDTIIASKKSKELNSPNDGSCTLRRSPRFCTRRSCVFPSEGKMRESRKSSSGVNESYGEEENAVSSSSRVKDSLGPTSVSLDLAGEFMWRPEIVSDLCATQAGLTIASSSRRPVVKADGDEGEREDLMDGRNEKDRLKMKNKFDSEGDCGVVQGWSKEQDMALQTAYFTAKPSPHFWKKVSKMVPGKSAQECFDRVHSDLITPHQPSRRSRAKNANLSPIPQFLLSASKLLKPTTPKTKILGHNKQRRNRLAQKTIRHLLEKQFHVDQAHERDLFSVLEPCSESNVHSTPTVEAGNPQKNRERSSSGHKRPRSRFTSTGKATTLTSPPVLKQIKNKALHEKYIDQLHSREAKRKAESARLLGKENTKPIVVQKDSVRAAKDALIFDVKDAIEKLKGLEADNSCSSSDFCFDHGESEEEGEATDL